MGGPDSLEAVEGFLFNLFSDPEMLRVPGPLRRPLARIVSLVRARMTARYYELMGGRSPQREQAQELARRLEEELGEGFAVRVAMRYWHPFTEEALRDLMRTKPRRIVLLPLYPQFSRTTTGSSFREFDRVYSGHQFPKLPVVKIWSYHDHPLYIRAMVENIKGSVRRPQDYFLLFTAHSLPESVIRKGDPYRKQTEETVRLIMEHFPNTDFALGYQSRIGPVRWIGPSTEELIRELARRGVERLLLIPVSFVNEHSETLYELDVRYRKVALSCGIKEFVRVPTLRTHPLFVRALRSLIEEALDCGKTEARG